MSRSGPADMIPQAALVELFRQSLAPLNQLGAGRLAMQQAGLEREYAAREYAARRAQQVEDHMAGLRLQSELGEASGARNAKLANELAIAREEAAARQRLTDQIQVGNNNAALNQQSAEAARLAAQVENARKLVTQLGITDIDPAKYQGDDRRFVEDVSFLAPIYTNKQRTELTDKATELAKMRQEAETEVQGIFAKMQLPESVAVSIAKPQLLALTTDKKQRAEFNKLTTLAEVESAMLSIEGGDMALGAVQKLIEAKAKSHARPYEQQLLERRSHAANINKLIMDLPPGVVPDYKSLRPAGGGGGGAGASGAAAAGGGAALSSADIDAVLPKGAPQPAPAGAEALGIMGAFDQEGLAGLVRPGSALRSAVRNAMPSPGGFLGAALGSVAREPARFVAGQAGEDAVRSVEGVLSGPVGQRWFGEASKMLAPVAPVAMAASPFLRGAAASGSLAGMALQGGFESELNSQRDQLSMIDGLIAQAHGRGDIETARRLRAAKYAPQVDDWGILNTMVQSPGDSFMLPTGRGASR